jgi:tetratricopeptide (TPR) repeat protein
MEITVNDQPLEFELEEETTLRDVMSGLNRWVTKGRNIITSVKLNDKSIPVREAECSELPVEEIKKLELEIESMLELALESLTDASEYLPKLIAAGERLNSLLRDEKKEEAGELVKQFEEGLSWFIHIIKGIKDILKVDLDKIYLKEKTIGERWVKLQEAEEKLKANVLSSDLSGVNEVIRGTLIPLINEWLVALPKILERIDAQEKALEEESKSIIGLLRDKQKQLPQIAKSLEEISVDLQTGSEAYAMERLQQTIDDISSAIRCLKRAEEIFGLDYECLAVKDQTVYQRSEELNNLLNEVITAFENKDLVLLADLLEYELAPLISRWEEVIGKVVEYIEKTPSTQ